VVLLTINQVLVKPNTRLKVSTAMYYLTFLAAIYGLDLVEDRFRLSKYNDLMICGHVSKKQDSMQMFIGRVKSSVR
jgi:hypothetical protein